MIIFHVYVSYNTHFDKQYVSDSCKHSEIVTKCYTNLSFYVERNLQYTCLNLRLTLTQILLIFQIVTMFYASTGSTSTCPWAIVCIWCKVFD